MCSQRASIPGVRGQRATWPFAQKTARDHGRGLASPQNRHRSLMQCQANRRRLQKWQECGKNAVRGQQAQNVYGAGSRGNLHLTTTTASRSFISPSQYPLPIFRPQPPHSPAIPRRDAPKGEQGDHRELLPETGAKRPLSGAFGARVDRGGAAAAKLPDASSLLPERAANSWLCAQDMRTGCIGDALATTVAALADCSAGAILAT
jgi:hypothetical protein